MQSTSEESFLHEKHGKFHIKGPEPFQNLQSEFFKKSSKIDLPTSDILILEHHNFPWHLLSHINIVKMDKSGIHIFETIKVPRKTH